MSNYKEIPLLKIDKERDTCRNRAEKKQASPQALQVVYYERHKISQADRNKHPEHKFCGTVCSVKKQACKQKQNPLNAKSLAHSVINHSKRSETCPKPKRHNGEIIYDEF
ncbi:MAG: hypothetical protein K5917_00795 [Clostridiales bacterium]|nr:hypothetical protein [Clostridiales bacterium]